MRPSSVRADVAWVAGNAEHVIIHHDKIEPYAQSLFKKYTITSDMDASHHFVDKNDPQKTTHYMMALDSINFGSGYFKTAQQSGVPLEYEYIADHLKKAFDQDYFSTPASWCDITITDCHGIFKTPSGVDTDIDFLIGKFAEHLKFTGEYLCRDFNGDGLTFLTKAEHCADNIVDIVSNWDHFKDVHEYKGKSISILKRAQILAGDLFLSLSGTDHAIKNIDALTIFADNMVPHVLRYDGIISYTPELTNKIEKGIEITPSSAEEIEIRAIAIHVVELMKEFAPTGVSAMNVDHILWNRGYEADIYNLPTHQTKTIWY